ncbi:MAG: protein-L-isoaspartate(D-aspartate) O-methyltransferase [Pseudomonadales bacterium]|nr:protein-L-isoaspartate(D-aspartate) O-methyltransferase [Pseudomonadota bacterium]MEC7553963.1 protein-L-isoaspartate(D-aspartate) O-methyltransferase [Pseudomonadota bacterium]MEC7662122.1 protein-L-isoaspartate(D-aspartate) O-methyltransferase [Pseudomonadota bacterium]MEC7990097.1 protein-L-isoaspartate(D-aspartate) O-methyltransferase [Pseudomonadota bacterium]MEC8070752.1 protein-L-isoaspartate(D-aspartate) O-methyltransferase [Pseudomonadota bacterium]
MTSQRTRDRLVARLREQGIDNNEVLACMGAVPRHIFVDEAMAHRSYEDTALPIGHNQTISQPFIVALMTQLLCEVKPRQVLEVGTGSGYQTAVLSYFCHRLYSIERISALTKRAQKRLAAMSVKNTVLKHGDGYGGWEVHAPFDAIMVTAAPPAVPEALLDQLAVGGRLIVPVGDDAVQELIVIDRTKDGFLERVHDRVKFVPLVSGTSSR